MCHHSVTPMETEQSVFGCQRLTGHWKPQVKLDIRHNIGTYTERNTIHNLLRENGEYKAD